MAYIIYDKKKKKAAFSGETFSTEKQAKTAIIDTISGAMSGTGDINRAIYYLDNFIVKKVVIKKVSPAKKRTTKNK